MGATMRYLAEEINTQTLTTVKNSEKVTDCLIFAYQTKKMTDNSDLSGVDEVVSEAETKKSKKENKSLISSTKKEKKKAKEKETRYAHLGDESSGEEDVDGKSPLKLKKPKPFMF